MQINPATQVVPASGRRTSVLAPAHSPAANHIEGEHAKPVARPEIGRPGRIYDASGHAAHSQQTHTRNATTAEDISPLAKRALQAYNAHPDTSNSNSPDSDFILGIDTYA